MRLLTLAVFDDVVALLVIATVYTEHIDTVALLVAIALFAALFAARFVPSTWRRPVAVLLGVGAWVAMHESGIDPLITGLAVGLITSAYQPARADLEEVTELARAFREQPTPELARTAQLGMSNAISPNERLQYRLHPWTSFVIVPLFALANTGIHIDSELLARRDHVADHARDRRRLRDRQAGRDLRRGRARDRAVEERAASRPELAGADRGRDRLRRRLHGLAADRQPRLRRARTSRRPSWARWPPP